MTHTRREASLLAEGAARIRGDGPAPSTSDPREVQEAFDRDYRGRAPYGTPVVPKRTKCGMALACVVGLVMWAVIIAACYAVAVAFGVAG